MQLNIVKIGGPVVEDPQLLAGILNDFARLEGPKILVHGGGKAASELAKQLDIPVQMTNGRRITDTATLAIATMVYAGKINKKIVAQLQQYDCNAIGLSGADANVIRAKKRSPSPIDYGWVGDIEAVNTTVLNHFLNTLKLSPVCCALTHDKQGQLLNTNADSIAAALAIALQPHFDVRLLFCSDTHGVYADLSNPASLIPQLEHKHYKNLIELGVITAGMLPKLDNAFTALQQGVSSVAIGGPKSLSPNAKKTQLI